MGLQNGTAALGESFSSSLKMSTYTCDITQPSCSRHVPKRAEGIRLQKNLYTNVCSGFIYNRPQMEITKMSINCVWVNSVVHPYDRILPGRKRNKLLTHAPKWVNLKCFLPSERRVNCMTSFIRHLERERWLGQKLHQ